uniref:BCD1 alpha/beta domain-containing protein n=1 Tax=Mycena chlorophos TaxID=658473 RepID=A0ABQ0LVE4_MYCCL|nr:predicted protein [Mycena chlorophos]
MNAYSWGTMMDDYTYLEEIGRKVGEWGGEIAKGRYQVGFGVVGGRGGRGQARGRGRGHGRETNTRTKRDVLKMQLEALDIEMDVLPAGMERHGQNQSTWDFRTRAAQLTIEFVFNPPEHTTSNDKPRAVKLLTHRNQLSTTLLAILQHVGERKGVPPWVKALVCPDLDAPENFVAPQCVMRARGGGNAYFRFDPREDLEATLRNTQFVEYPTIEVWEEFRGRVVDKVGKVTQEAERPAKRRKIDKKAGGKAIAGLLDGYGSSEEEEQNQEEEKPDGLEMLGGYSGSDDEDGVQLDPAALLELMRQARGDDNWVPPNMDQDNDDEVDWGDSD